MWLTAKWHVLATNCLPEGCIWHGEGHAEADAALEGCVDGFWLVGDQHHNANVSLQMMQQHTYTAIQCCRNSLYPVTASVLTFRHHQGHMH